jgi:hypothetical protein
MSSQVRLNRAGPRPRPRSCLRSRRGLPRRKRRLRRTARQLEPIGARTAHRAYGLVKHPARLGTRLRRLSQSGACLQRRSGRSAVLVPAARRPRRPSPHRRLVASSACPFHRRNDPWRAKLCAPADLADDLPRRSLEDVEAGFVVGEKHCADVADCHALLREPFSGRASTAACGSGFLQPRSWDVRFREVAWHANALHFRPAWRGRLCRQAPPVRSSWTSEVGAVAGAGLADQSRCAGRNELHHDIHQGNAALVPDNVHVAGWFEGARPGLDHV